MGRLGGEIILLSCCKRLQINGTFIQVVTAFTVPLFDEFMRRIMPGEDWKA